MPRERMSTGLQKNYFPAFQFFLSCGETQRFKRLIRALFLPMKRIGRLNISMRFSQGRIRWKQWNALPSFSDSLSAFAPRPRLLVAAEADNIFPPSDYADSIAAFSNIQLIRHAESDHGFSACRTWLVETVTDWLVAELGT